MILGKKLFPLWIIGIIFILSGCSSALNTVDELYPMQDLVYDESGNKSNIFKAYDSSLKQVTNNIIEEDEAIDVSSKQDDRTVLVYDEHLIQIYQDIKNKDDVLIEVSDEKFVRQNYTTDYFTTYGIAESAEEAYDMNLDDRDGGNFYYFGYIGNSGYVKNTGIPTVRFGSTVSNPVRGGGPGAGK